MRRWGLCAHEGEKAALTPTIHTAVGSVLLIVHMGQCQLLGVWLCLASVRASRAHVRACAQARGANCEGRKAVGPDAPTARAQGFRAGTRRGAPRTETISSSWGWPGVDRMLSRHTLAHTLSITTHLHPPPHRVQEPGRRTSESGWDASASGHASAPCAGGGGREDIPAVPCSPVGYGHHERQNLEHCLPPCVRVKCIYGKGNCVYSARARRL